MDTLTGLDQMRIGNDNNSRLAEIKRAERAAKAKADHAKLEKAAEDFEAIFIGQMLQHMFAGIETNELTGGGQSEDVYRSMLVDEYAKIMSKTGGIGVADHVKREMLRTQEVDAQAAAMLQEQDTLHQQNLEGEE